MFTVYSICKQNMNVFLLGIVLKKQFIVMETAIILHPYFLFH